MQCIFIFCIGEHFGRVVLIGDVGAADALEDCGVIVWLFIATSDFPVANGVDLVDELIVSVEVWRIGFCCMYYRYKVFIIPFTQYAIDFIDKASGVWVVVEREEEDSDVEGVVL